MKVVFFSPGFQVKDIHELENRPRGGMVNSLFYVSEHLAKYHDVTVCAGIETQGITSSGVKWWNVPDESCDVLILNRGAYDLLPFIKAKRRIVWAHDLPHAGFVMDKQYLNNIDTFVVMSRYCDKIWRSMFPGIKKTALIPNGVDKSLFYYDHEQKDRYKIIYFAHPNRGINRVPFIVDCLLAKNHCVTCDIYSGASMYPNEKGGDSNYVGEEFLIEEQYKTEYPDRVKFHAPIPRDQIAKEVRSAGVYLLPTGFPEICGNTILQALSCGTPVFTTGKLGFIEEWITSGKNGYLTEFGPWDYMAYHTQLIRALDDVFWDRRLHEKLMVGASKTGVLSWKEVGEKWNKLIKG